MSDNFTWREKSEETTSEAEETTLLTIFDYEEEVEVDEPITITTTSTVSPVTISSTSTTSSTTVQSQQEPQVCQLQNY